MQIKKGLFIVQILIFIAMMSAQNSDTGYDIRKLTWGMSTKDVASIEGSSHFIRRNFDRFGITIYFDYLKNGLYRLRYEKIGTVNFDVSFHQVITKKLSEKYGLYKHGIDCFALKDKMLRGGLFFRQHTEICDAIATIIKKDDYIGIPDLKKREKWKSTLSMCLIPSKIWSYGKTMVYLPEVGNNVIYIDQREVIKCKVWIIDFLQRIKSETKKRGNPMEN